MGGAGGVPQARTCSRVTSSRGPPGKSWAHAGAQQGLWVELPQSCHRLTTELPEVTRKALHGVREAVQSAWPAPGTGAAALCV